MVLILRLPKVPFQKLPFVSRTDGGEGDGGTTGIRGGGGHGKVLFVYFTFKSVWRSLNIKKRLLFSFLIYGWVLTPPPP